MDPMRTNPVGPTQYGAAFAPVPAQPATAPGDSVQIGSEKKSSLLDKAKNLGLGASVGLSATVLLDSLAIAGAAAVVGTASGLVALVATGLAVAHFGKKAVNHFRGGQAQGAPAPPPPPGGHPAPPQGPVPGPPPPPPGQPQQIQWNITR